VIAIDRGIPHYGTVETHSTGRHISQKTTRAGELISGTASRDELAQTSDELKESQRRSDTVVCASLSCRAARLGHPAAIQHHDREPQRDERQARVEHQEHREQHEQECGHCLVELRK
jgi:hypothetical protein